MIDAYGDGSSDDPHARFRAIVAKHFGNIDSKLNARKIEERPPAGLTGEALISELLEAFSTDWWSKPATGIDGNWNWRAGDVPYAAIGEVALERRIVAACGPKRDWTFQMSTMSGLVDHRRHKRRAIDLVHRIGPNHYEFIELKVTSDNPIYAAFEILGYGLAYCRARQHRWPNPDAGMFDVLAARHVDLVVLGPKRWYSYKVRDVDITIPWRLQRLTMLLNAGLDGLPARLGIDGLDSISFGYRLFESDEDLLADVEAGRPGGREYARGDPGRDLPRER